MGCTHDCSSCSSDCKSKEQNLHEELNKYSSVKKVIGIVSGKGGVGKSLVTSMLAVTFNRLGKSTAVLDADITGPFRKRLSVYRLSKVTHPLITLYRNQGNRTNGN